MLIKEPEGEQVLVDYMATAVQTAPAPAAPRHMAWDSSINEATQLQASGAFAGSGQASVLRFQHPLRIENTVSS